MTSSWNEIIEQMDAKEAEHERRLREDRGYRYRCRLRDFYYGVTSRWYRFWSNAFNRTFYRRIGQRITRGWDDSDTWSLDITFAEWMLPRLRRYRKLAGEHIIIEPEQEARIVTAIAALEIIRDGRDNFGTSEDADLAKRGLQIIAEDIQGWWW